MTTAAGTVTEGWTPLSGAKASGRSRDVWGARKVAFFEISAITVGSGTVPFDWDDQKLDFVPTRITGTYRQGASDGSVYNVVSFDPVLDVFNFWDVTADDNADGDQPTGVIQVLVIGE